MKWICPKCHSISSIPGECSLCQEKLQPLPPVPLLPKVVQTILDDPKALTAALQLANTLAQKLFK